MRAAVAKVPGVSVLFTTPLGMRIDEGLGGTPADIAVRIFGPDLDRLARLGERAEAIARRVRGLADLRAEQLTGLPQLRVTVDRAGGRPGGADPGRRRPRRAHRPGGREGLGGLGRPAALRPGGAAAGRAPPAT